ncbi:predicted protein [Plenodomus lingam JN3]|uniref:Predicted protein n=1 Tax=Leptosphaeria maculans (strain JN3 / isolate v23.1.3 / race Av1-4-5-6-7-8) TaxID=985895 RepID=E4ZK28_LEPMJ|nr:predicted protein [Plenodomus lingam JN3]CBX91623.1 predicted protein [Plenodomus lingam JN3]
MSETKQTTSRSNCRALYQSLYLEESAKMELYFQ